MSAKFPSGGGAGPFLARSLIESSNKLSLFILTGHIAACYHVLIMLKSSNFNIYDYQDEHK